MATWIDEKANQIKELEKQREVEHQWQLHQTEVIRSRGREILEQLESVVRGDVDKWNANFPNDPVRKIDGVFKRMPSGFRVHKTHFPSSTLDVEFQPDSQSILFQITKNRPVDGETYTIANRFHLRLDKNQSIYLTRHDGQHISLEEASRLLLEPMVEDY